MKNTFVLKSRKTSEAFFKGLSISGTNGNRTSDTRIFSPLLYQLSYGTIKIFNLSNHICYFLIASAKVVAFF